MFTDIFIRRPVLAAVVSMIILIGGLGAALHLPLRQYPALTDTSFVITTAYPGANAELVRGLVTRPIERAVAAIEGIDTLTSASSQNVSVVTIKVALDADASRMMMDLLAKLDEVQAQLPPTSKAPVLTRTGHSGTAMLYVAVTSTSVSAAKITDYLRIHVQPKLLVIDGVAGVSIYGGKAQAVRIWLDPQRMAGHAITARDILATLNAENIATTAGDAAGKFVDVAIRVGTAPGDLNAFADMEIMSPSGSIARLKDVARIALEPTDEKSSVYVDGHKGVLIAINAAVDANPIEVVDRVRAALPRFESELPAALQLSVAYDATVFIRASIKEVAATIVGSAIIVIAIVLLFLGSLRATLVPVLVIPLSLIGSFVIMAGLGFSINLLTLLAMVLAIGLVVDDAIVVVENVQRHIEDGRSQLDAARIGAREIALPVVAMTLTLAAVYAPIGFVGGLTGTLFREFAFSLAGAVIVSGVVALTLSPIMCAKLLKNLPTPSSRPRTEPRHQRALNWLALNYRALLLRALAHKPAVIIVLAGVVSATAIMFLTVKSELAPAEDQGFLINVVEAPSHTNLHYLEKTSRQVGVVLARQPEALHVFTINGSPNSNSAFVGLMLKPLDQRKRTEMEVLAGLRGELAAIPGGIVRSFAAPPLPGAGNGAPLQFVVTTTGDDKILAVMANRLTKAAKESGRFLFVGSDLAFDAPLEQILIDHQAARALGVSMAEIAGNLALLSGGGSIGQFNHDGFSRDIILQVPETDRASAEAMLRFHVRTASGKLVPLSSVARVANGVQAKELKRFNELNAAMISAVPMPGVSLGEAIAFMKKLAEDQMTPEFGYQLAGEARQFEHEGAALALTFLLALVAIYLVLSVQFSSFRDPLIILIALPPSIFGAMIPLTLGMATSNIYTQIALVTLIGLIAKHGILMVDKANALVRERQLSRADAIVEASVLRMRPVLMTTAAMIAAMVPLIVATGAGAASRFDLGIVIAAGMAVGTIFTLFVTPVVYALIAPVTSPLIIEHSASTSVGARAGDDHPETGRDFDRAAGAAG